MFRYKPIWHTWVRLFANLSNDVTPNRRIQCRILPKIRRNAENHASVACTVALTEFSSRGFSLKEHLKKKSAIKNKIDVNIKEIKIPIDYRLIAVFFRGALLRANSSYLPAA